MEDLDLNEVWARTLESLSSGALTPQQRAFVTLTRPLGIVGDTALVAAPNEFTKDVLESRLSPIVCDALSATLGREMRLAVTVDESIAPDLDDEATDDEGGRHHRGREQMRLDGIAKQEAQQHSRKKGDQHIQSKATRQTLAGQSHDGALDFLPINNDHRQDGAGLDGDVKNLGFLVVKAQQSPREDKVASGRDGQKLGQTFHDAHHCSLQKQREIHDVSL